MPSTGRHNGSQTAPIRRYGQGPPGGSAVSADTLPGTARSPPEPAPDAPVPSCCCGPGSALPPGTNPKHPIGIRRHAASRCHRRRTTASPTTSGDSRRRLVVAASHSPRITSGLIRRGRRERMSSFGPCNHRSGLLSQAPSRIRNSPRHCSLLMTPDNVAFARYAARPRR